MEKIENVIIEFDAFIKGTDGVVVPFSFKIAAPEYDEKRGYFCRLICPYIRPYVLSIFGYDEKQACELSLKFIASWIDDEECLVDKLGETVKFPAPPAFIDYANDRF